MILHPIKNIFVKLFALLCLWRNSLLAAKNDLIYWHTSNTKK